MSKRQQVSWGYTESIEQNEYTQKDVAELLGMKAQTVAYYTNQGIIVPSIANPKGRGTTRKYSKKNLIEFLLLSLLSDHGLSIARIKRIVEVFWDNLPHSQYKIERDTEEGGAKGSLSDSEYRIRIRDLYDLSFLKNSRILLFLYDIHADKDKVTLRVSEIPRSYGKKNQTNIDQLRYQREIISAMVDGSFFSVLCIDISEVCMSVAAM